MPTAFRERHHQPLGHLSPHSDFNTDGADGQAGLTSGVFHAGTHLQLTSPVHLDRWSNSARWLSTPVLPAGQTLVLIPGSPPGIRTKPMLLMPEIVTMQSPLLRARPHQSPSKRLVVSIQSLMATDTIGIPSGGISEPGSTFLYWSITTPD